jgi:hypothetical protein
MRGQYVFDEDKVRFRKVKISFWTVLRRMLLLFVASVSMAVLYYIVIALFVSTEEERLLKMENRMYEREIPELEARERLLSDVVMGLQVRDDRIYEEIFHTSAPNMDPGSSLEFLAGLDSISDNNIVMRSAGKIDVLEHRAARIEDNFRQIVGMVQSEDLAVPPMMNPLEDFSFAQTGASTGERINPFYKVKIMHNGLDMIAPAGDPVYAAADGYVKDVVKSRKGLGNVVTIDHDNGYVTRYAHLADIEVRKGRWIKKGTRIGYVGVSGNSFAPHLHYEVIRDTTILDPVNYFFSSVTPDEYVNMLIMSASTGQSMD